MEIEKILKLIDNFGNAALRAGNSNSGLTINVRASYDWKDMQELRAQLKQEITELANNPSLSLSEKEQRRH